MRKLIKRKSLEQVHTFLLAERGGVELWILLVALLGIIITLYTVDTEIGRVKAMKRDIQGQLVMSLQGASKRIDFYEASEGRLVIEYDFVEQFERYMQEALLLDNTLRPLDEKDFGIIGPVTVDSVYAVTSGYDSLSGYTFKNTGLVAMIQVPMKFEFLGIEMPMSIPIKAFSEIRN